LEEAEGAGPHLGCITNHVAEVALPVQRSALIITPRSLTDDEAEMVTPVEVV